MPLTLDSTGGVAGMIAGDGLALFDAVPGAAPRLCRDDEAWATGFSVVVAYDEDEEEDDGDFMGDEEDGDEEEYFDEDEEFEDEEEFDDDGDEDEEL